MIRIGMTVKAARASDVKRVNLDQNERNWTNPFTADPAKALHFLQREHMRGRSWES